ncbi:MAG: sensor histidine kinase, partial [Oceanibaculum sp.]
MSPTPPDRPMTPYELTHPVRLHTLVMLRWVAVSGQAATLLVTYFWLGFDLPIELGFTIVGLLALLNLSTALRQPSSAR